MPRFAANLSMLFTEVPLLARIARAKDAGFSAVEIQFPYELEPEALARALADAGLPLVLVNVPAADLLAGGPGLACVPGREAEFAAAVETAVRYATALSVPQVNVLAGRVPPGLSADVCRDVLVSNLRHAHARLSEHGIGVLVEPINTFDMPGFLVATADEALDVIARTAVPVRIQYDVYHAVRMGADVHAELRGHAAHIGHVQFADVPGRGAPGTGDVDFASIFELVDGIGLDVPCGAEYRPGRPTDSTLDWLADARGRSP